MRGGWKLNVRISLACNNRNGIHCGWFDAMRIHTAADVLITLDTPRTVTREFWASGRIATVRIGRLLFSCVGYAHNVGNLAWNEYTVPQADNYIKLLMGLDRRGAQCDSVTVPNALGIDPDIHSWAVLATAGRATDG